METYARLIRQHVVHEASDTSSADFRTFRDASEAQGQLVLQDCLKAHLQRSGQSVMFTNVDLLTVQEYHDKVYGDTRKLAGQEVASFN